MGKTTLHEARRDLETAAYDLGDIFERHHHVVAAEDLAERLEGVPGTNPDDARELARMIVAGEGTWDGSQ